MQQHVDDMHCIQMHQSVRFGEIIAPKPRQQQVIGLSGRAMLREVAYLTLSSVTRATDNDVDCVRRFVKFARQKSFSG